MHKKFQFSVLVLIFALIGCKTSKVVKADKTIQAVEKNLAVLRSAPDKINAVTNSLDELLREGGDMRAEFQAFDKEVKNVILHRDQFRKLRGNLNVAKNAFMESWSERQRTIHNQELRDRSRNRRATIIAMFHELDGLLSEARSDLEPWLQKVVDIRTYLEIDLSRGGVDSVVDLVPPISRDAKNLNAKVTYLIAKLNRFSNTITPASTLD